MSVQTSVQWLTPGDAAEYLQVSLRTIQGWTSERRLPSYAIGAIVRYKASDLDKLMEKAKRGL